MQKQTKLIKTPLALQWRFLRQTNAPCININVTLLTFRFVKTSSHDSRLKILVVIIALFFSILLSFKLITCLITIKHY